MDRQTDRYRQQELASDIVRCMLKIGYMGHMLRGSSGNNSVGIEGKVSGVRRRGQQGRPGLMMLKNEV